MTDPNEAPKKLLTRRQILDSPPPLFLSLQNLGQVQVGHLTMNAFIKLAPALEADSIIDDRVLVRKLMAAVITLPPVDDTATATHLSDADMERITDADMESFARSFMAREGWTPEVDILDPAASWIPSLAKSVRSTVQELAAGTKKTLERMNGILGPTTQQLFMQNAAFSEQLKELGGMRSALDRAKDALGESSLARLHGQLKGSELEQLKRMSTPGNSAWEAASKYLETNSVARATDAQKESQTNRLFVAPPIDFDALHRNNPANQTAKGMGELNRQAQEMMVIARTMAAANGNINQLVSNAMVQFETKRIADTKGIKLNLAIAMFSLVASVLIGAFSLWYGYQAYALAEIAGKDDAVQQAKVERHQAAQLSATYELIKLQRDGNAAFLQRIEKREVENGLPKKAAYEAASTNIRAR